MLEAQIFQLPPEQKPISVKFRQMLALPNFKKAIRYAAKQTSETGLETGFEVDWNRDNSFSIEGVKVGGTAGMDNAKITKEIDGPRDYDLPFQEFFHFHFHPGEKGFIIPSPSDMKAFIHKDVQPDYIGVGQVDRQGSITVLVVAKPKYRLIREDIRSYEEGLGSIRSQKELKELMNSIGLSSFMFIFL